MVDSQDLYLGFWIQAEKKSYNFEMRDHDAEHEIQFPVQI